MKALPVLLMVMCFVTAGCSEDPARSVKVVARPAQQASVKASPAPSPAAQPAAHPAKTSAAPPPPRPATKLPPAPSWLQEFCPIPAEDSAGPSNLIVKGPCEFQHQGAVSCLATGDDFIVALTRKAREGTLVTFINVEHYKSPGAYDGAQIFVALQKGTTIHRWSSDSVNMTVGPGEAFVELPRTRLELEPTLKDCSILIGPATNYQFQCGGLDYAKSAGDKADEVVSGKLQCAGKE